MTDRDTLEALADLLAEWQDLPGVTRIELRPINKHTGGCLIDQDDVPSLPLETLGPDVEDARRALTVADFIRELLG